MNTQNTVRNILVPVDGTQRSLGTLRYLANTEPFHDAKAVLFHVFNTIPSCFRDLNQNPSLRSAVLEAHSWERQQKRNMDEYALKARQILLNGGFEDGSVKVKVRDRKKSIARDIIKETKQGYDAVVMRRRGMATLSSAIVGGVANKILEKVHFLPLVIVGKKPVNQKVLLAVDGSPGAAQAVDFAAKVLGGYDYTAEVVSVIRDEVGLGGTYTEAAVLEECRKDAKAVVEASLDEARATLIAHGFDPSSVTTKVITDTPSRAGAIAQEAKSGDFSTIVVGRRGISRVKDFYMGRVSNKLIHAARQHTIWVVT